ncbi:MAG: exo-alpha-sialidase [Spirochaetes bacterium]|nr:exo-alpha-sialidase [Spirochaetota bacterium]
MKNIIINIMHFFPAMPFYKKAAWTILILSTLSLCYIMIFDNSRVSTLPVGWEKKYYITPYDLNVKNIKLDRRGSIIAVVYEGEKNKSSGIYISLSFDDGAKFLQPVKIAEISSKTDSYPDVSVSRNGHIAAVWQKLTEADPNSRIYYAVSADMGATWNEPARFNSPTEMELLPKAFYDERNRLHIFYTAYKESGFNLFHVVSEDEKSFSSPESLVEISADLRGAFFPAIRMDGNDIYIVWQGKEKSGETISDNLYFIKSSNSGRSWTSKRLITKSVTKDSSPFISSYNNDIYLVYQNNEAKNWAIKLIRGTERGNNWSEPAIVSTTNADCYSPLIVRSEDGNLFVIWYDLRNKMPGIFARKLPPQMQNPPAEVMLSRTGVSAKKPLAVSLGRKVMVLWEEAGRVTAKNTDVHVDPPVVYSPTHPENVWSKASRAIIKWTPPADESGISGYAVFFKRSEDYNLPDIDPAIANLEGNVTEYRTPEISDGISYFYIRAVDGAGNYSRTIRYKIQVSKNPPSMPIVKSITHPEGKAAESVNAAFNWSVADAAALKGFLYGISKNTIIAPDKFTTEREAKFNNLSEGRHFFSLRSVTKTNVLSPVAYYEIIVGRAEKLDPEQFRKIAQGIIEEKPQIIRPVKLKIPLIEIKFPFDITKDFDNTSFNAEITGINFDNKEIIGYSFYVGKEEKQPLDRINLKGNIINISGLQGGEYFLSVKCRYAQYKNRKKIYLWTEPVISQFKVAIPVQESPVIAFLKMIINRLAVSIPASAAMIVIILSVMTIGFGAKVSFYSKLFRLKLSNVFRIFL